MGSKIRIHHFVPLSLANGPGKRAVIWVQGCTLGCQGCFNPDTHPTTGGQLTTVDELVARILRHKERIEGLSISGGEPLQQFPAVLQLLQKVRARSRLSSVLFSGYRWQEILEMPHHKALFASLDILVAGRYEAALYKPTAMRASSNQTIHFLSDRYRAQDSEDVPLAEIIINPDGSKTLSGIAPVSLLK